VKNQLWNFSELFSFVFRYSFSKFVIQPHPLENTSCWWFDSIAVHIESLIEWEMLWSPICALLCSCFSLS